MLEIDKLKRTNAMQKTQLAELEARLTDSERQTEKDSGRSASAKPNAGTAQLLLYCLLSCLRTFLSYFAELLLLASKW